MRAPSNVHADAQADAVLSGARRARPSFLRGLVSRAAARELHAFVVPGPEVARARGLDLGGAGLRVATNPRHADVLLIVGELPEGLREASAVVYAQMPRPRAVLAAGAEDVSPLAGADVSVGCNQDALSSGVAELRRLFETGVFDAGARGFEAPALRSRTEYTCSMHPEVVQDEPGTCPRCGMELVPREAQEEEGEMDGNDGGHEGTHHAGGGEGFGEQPGEQRAEHHDEGHDHEGHGHEGHGHTRQVDIDRQEVSDGAGESHAHRTHSHHGAQGERGGSNHAGSGHGVEDEAEGGDVGESERGGHGGMDHDAHGGHEDMDDGGHEHGDHGGMGFMSMVEMTQGTPRSSDGLQMEWVEAPFGPLFAGLPGGLSLTFTLDGDTVAQTEAGSTVGVRAREDLNGPVESFVERLARLDPLSPFSYRLLALRAVEGAARAREDESVALESVALARVGALERERAASHLNWLAGFGHLIGYSWLARRAEELQLALLRADAEEVAVIRTGVRILARRVERTPLLRRKLAGIGKVGDLDGATGPVARTGGRRIDARLEEETYLSLGFEPVVMEGDDALGRLRARLAEAEQSLDFVEKAGGVSTPGAPPETCGASGRGAATVETPRGAAKLALMLEGGEVSVTELKTPSARHVGLVKAVTEQRELADALVGVASLDLSPWEVAR